MLPKQDNFLDTFIVDFYSSTSLKIKPIVGWGIVDSLSYDILTNNFCATIKIYDECIDGILHKYIDALISFQTGDRVFFSIDTLFLYAFCHWLFHLFLADLDYQNRTRIEEV